MSNDVKNVFAAMPRATGALLHGDLGIELPDSAKDDIETFELEDLGFIGEDGFTQSESRSTDKKKAFGGTVVKVLQTDYSLTIQFAFLESISAKVLKSIYGATNVEVREDGEIVVRKNKMQSPNASWVIDVFDGNALNRSVVGNGQIIEVDDIVKVHSDTIMYTVTMECFEDDNGDNLIEYFAMAGGADGVRLTIATGSVPPAKVGVAYPATTLVSAGADGTKAWSLADGTLPAGLTLAAGTGTITGTPTAAGTSDFTVRVTDGGGETATRSYTIVVAAA